MNNLKLERQHIAHAKSVSEGINWLDSARRYLNATTIEDAKKKHLMVMDAIRVIGRRLDISSWRLIGVNLKSPENDNLSLEEFVAERNLEGWSESEQIEMYKECYTNSTRKKCRNERLRERQIELLRLIERTSEVHAKPEDPVSGWFDALTSNQLISNKISTLSELGKLINSKKCWYSNISGIGLIKASKIERLMKAICPESELKMFSPKVMLNDLSLNADSNILIPLNIRDIDLIKKWIIEAQSESSRKSYLREINRLILWIEKEKNIKSILEITADECIEYVKFLENIPSHWISKHRALPGEKNWGPFRGQLNKKSIYQSIAICSGFFNWLKYHGYKKINPWYGIKIEQGNECKYKKLSMIKTYGDKILTCAETLPKSSSTDRIAFTIKFLRDAKGLKPTELLSIKIGDFFVNHSENLLELFLRKNGTVKKIILPYSTLALIDEYLEKRGIGNMRECDKNVPLIPNIVNKDEGIGYQSFYDHINLWINKSNIGAKEIFTQ